MSRSRFRFLVLGVGLSFLFVLPLLFFLLRLLDRQTGEFLSVLFRPRTLQLIVNTLLLIASVLVLCTILALPVAYLLGRRNFVGSRIVHALLTLPLSVPGYIIAWSLLGLSGDWGILKTSTGMDFPSLRGLGGAALAISLYCFPILAINLFQGFRELDVRLEEAAKTLGKTRWERFWHVTLPQLWPSFLSGWVLIALYVLSDFGVPVLMGYEVLASAIYTEIITSLFQAGAFVLTLISLATTLFLLFLFHTHRQRPYHRLAHGRPLAQNRPIRTNLAWTIVLFNLVPTFLIPLLSLGHWLSLTSTWESFTAYNYLFSALWGTLQFALAGSLIGTLAALAVGLMQRFLRGRVFDLPGQFLFLLYSLPGTALALCWAIFFLQALPSLYQTTLGYVIPLGYLAASLALGPIQTALCAQSDTWTHSARTLGKSPIDIFAQVLWPGIRGGVLSGLFLSLGWIVRELPLAAILTPLGARTLSLAVFSHTIEANYAGAAPYALTLMVLGLGFGLLSSFRRPQYDA